MELIAGDSTLKFSEETSTVTISGSMRLANLTEYEKVKKFLNEAVAKTDKEFIINMKELQFLNSSGITTLSMFVISQKKLAKIKLKIIGSNDISWQEKSLTNFNKLWNDVEIIVE